jgi:pectinesterase
VIAGHSAGGELAAFIGSINKPDCHVNAVIDIDGTLAFIHPESGEGDDSKKISSATYWFGYSKTENPDLWKDAAPLSHVNAHSAPVLFINSAVERMHAGRNDYIKLLNQYNIYSEVKTFYEAPHTFCFFNPWFEPMVETMDQFIKKVLK